MAEKETAIQNAICAYLSTRTDLMFWVSKNASTYDATRGCFRKLGKWQRRGVPDITGIMDDGRILLIEVKTKTGRLSQHQREFHEQAKNMGALLIVGRSVEDVQKGLDMGMCGDII